MEPILNSNISVTFSVKCNCNISKSKLVFSLSNESYFSLIALPVQKLYYESNRSAIFGTPGICIKFLLKRPLLIFSLTHHTAIWMF